MFCDFNAVIIQPKSAIRVFKCVWVIAIVVLLLGSQAFGGELYFYQINAQVLTQKNLESLSDSIFTPKDIADQVLKDIVGAAHTQFQQSFKVESLLGTHFHYQQNINGLNVENSQITISIENRTPVARRLKSTNFQVVEMQYKAIQFPFVRIYDNRQTGDFSKVSFTLKNTMSEKQLTQIAWRHLKASGQLFDLPKIKSLIKNVSSGNDEKSYYKKVFCVEIFLENPYGSWAVYIDSQTQQVISAERMELARKYNFSHQERGQDGTDESFKMAWDLIQKRQDDMKNQQESSNKSELQLFANNNLEKGSAMVFDVDPKTALLDESLNNEFPRDLFNGAYVRRELKEIRFDHLSGLYHLEGPWVMLRDFDPPRGTPSVSRSREWRSERGDGSFNDVMTYYHIDKNQRYVQSLGYVGSRLIQKEPIRVDSNGSNGRDNSYFSRRDKRLSFGHGGVDDNEDADVILHEYGHALQHFINPDFVGGDAGAMGEGFGDYWAGSMSYREENGDTFYPHRVFVWDGHNEFWPGRSMNRLSYRYDESNTYGAHEVVSGVLSDELWSTPLFQSLVAINARGYSLEGVDRIILEAHFGLGSQPTMVEMATSIYYVAKRLQPLDEHAEIFLNHFMQMGILKSAPDLPDLPPVAAVDEPHLPASYGQQVTIVSESQDPENSSLHYDWRQVLGPPVKIISATNTDLLIFEAPDADVRIRFELIVTDQNAQSDLTTITVDVSQKGEEIKPLEIGSAANEDVDINPTSLTQMGSLWFLPWLLMNLIRKKHIAV